MSGQLCPECKHYVRDHWPESLGDWYKCLRCVLNGDPDPCRCFGEVFRNCYPRARRRKLKEPYERKL